MPGIQTDTSERSEKTTRRQSLFTPLEETVDTKGYDPAADPPTSLRDSLGATNLSSRAGSAMSWYSQILTKLRDLNSSGDTEALRSFAFAVLSDDF